MRVFQLHSPLNTYISMDIGIYVIEYKVYSENKIDSVYLFMKSFTFYGGNTIDESIFSL